MSVIKSYMLFGEAAEIAKLKENLYDNTGFELFSSDDESALIIITTADSPAKDTELKGLLDMHVHCSRLLLTGVYDFSNDVEVSDANSS